MMAKAVSRFLIEDKNQAKATAENLGAACRRVSTPHPGLVSRIKRVYKSHDSGPDVGLFDKAKLAPSAPACPQESALPPLFPSFTSVQIPLCSLWVPVE
jgi:hypothetical protein